MPVTAEGSLTARPGALEGTTVLDLSSVGPAARATRLLADYGARVVKVGPVPGRAGVATVPPAYAYSGHRGMRRVMLDLKAAGGRDAFLDLARGSDVVVESFRPGVVDRLGIGHEAVRAVNERIVYCSTSGYGQTGPRRDWAGHDLNYLAVSGYLHCSGRDGDGAPALPGATVADIAAGGMHAALAIMAALLRRERTGCGEHLDVSVADGALGMMALYADEHLSTGVDPGPGHYILTGRYACYGVYACADGEYLSVAAIEPAFWANLCRALDLKEYVDAQTDDSLQDEIREALATRFAAEDRDEWVRRLGPADCCVAPVNSVAEAVRDDQYLARGAVVKAEHPAEGPLEQIGPVWAGAALHDGSYSLPDPTDTDTAALLAEAGYDHDRLAALASAGVIA
ncbi:MAG: CaiB/BaiF CoA-transferase family protein [Acidimicrobiaceae bacterium]|nr:CaiB/BaiF CoA-transferase family protein [Acidimicrobiaceae bacterium]